MEAEVKELLEFLARSLVDHPEEVRVEATETERPSSWS